MQKEVLIIIPAYNEEKNISKVLDRLEHKIYSQMSQADIRSLRK